MMKSFYGLAVDSDRYKKKLAVRTGIFLPIILALFPSISTEAPNEQSKKSLAKIICQQYADPIRRDTISVCGAHAYDYLDDVVVTNFLPNNVEIANFVYTMPFTFKKFDDAKVSPIFKAKITYKDDLGRPIKTENGIFDVALPYDFGKSLIGIFTHIPQSSFTNANEITLSNSQTLTYGEAKSTSVSINSETTLGGIFSPIAVSGSTSISYLSNHYHSISYTTTVTELFNRRDVLGARVSWRIENYSYYLPVQIRRLRECKDNLLCKGDQGSYADEYFYQFVPVGDKIHIDCYQYQGGYYYYHDYNGQQYAVPLQAIWENTRLHHIRLNNVNDI